MSSDKWGQNTGCEAETYGEDVKKRLMPCKISTIDPLILLIFFPS